MVCTIATFRLKCEMDYNLFHKTDILNNLPPKSHKHFHCSTFLFLNDTCGAAGSNTLKPSFVVCISINILLQFALICNSTFTSYCQQPQKHLSEHVRKAGQEGCCLLWVTHISSSIKLCLEINKCRGQPHGPIYSCFLDVMKTRQQFNLFPTSHITTWLMTLVL